MNPFSSKSNVLKIYSILLWVNNSLWSMAAQKNSWKSILLSPSRSISLNIFYQWSPIPNSIKFSFASLNSEIEIVPLVSLSSYLNAYVYYFVHSFETLRSLNKEIIVFKNFDAFEKLYIFWNIYARSSFGNNSFKSFYLTIHSWFKSYFAVYLSSTSWVKAFLKKSIASGETF